ncbi:MAG: DUF393 domain-containing protein [bacterium]
MDGNVAPKEKAPEPAAAESCTLTVFYDGRCAACGAFAERMRRESGGSDAIAFLDANARCGELARAGISSEAATSKIHAVEPGGRVLTGVRALAAVWRTIPKYRWLAAIVSLPVIAQAAEWGYSVFARLRKLTK